MEAIRVKKAEELPGGFLQELITGVGKTDDRLVILLNADSILTAGEKMALSSIDAAPPVEGAT